MTTIVASKTQDSGSNRASNDASRLVHLMGLGLVLAPLLHSGDTIPSPQVMVVDYSQTTGTLPGKHQTISFSDPQLLKGFGRIYSELTEGRLDLPDEAKKVLYGNLWDLYY